MKISTKGRYALRMAVYLAKHQCDEYVSLKAIAESEDISKKYLEQIVPMLNRAGLLRTTRGNKGGYLLTKKAGEITVGDILRATEGSLAPALNTRSMIVHEKPSAPRFSFGRDFISRLRVTLTVSLCRILPIVTETAMITVYRQPLFS